MTARLLVYLLVLGWAIAFGWSIIASLGIDGPRNIDTGFRRLDVLFRGQMIAFGFAVVAGASGFLVGAAGKRDKIIGLLPISITALIVAGIALFAMLYDPPVPDGAPNTGHPTAPATDLSDNG